MKIRHRTILAMPLALLGAAVALAQTVDRKTVTTDSSGNLISGFTVPSGKTVTFAAGATLNLPDNALAIGDVSGLSTALGALQPLDSDLTAIAALTTTSFGRGLLDDADATAARSTLGLVIGTNVQAYDATLAGLASTSFDTSGQVAYATGTDAFATITTTSFGRSLWDDLDASAARSTLGLVIGTNVQAYDADLDAWSTKSAPSGAVVGTSDTQTLSAKNLSAETNNIPERSAALDRRYAAYYAETQAAHRVAYEDSAVWTDSFADLSNWNLAHGQPSGGRFYADANYGSNPNGANRSFVVGTGVSARVVSSINYVSPATGLVLIGVSKDTAGAAPTAGGTNFFGIAIQSGVGASSWTGGVGTAIPGVSAPPAGMLQAVIAIDASWISISLTSADGTWRAVTRIDRATFGAINNIAIWNTDSRQLSGSSIGPVGARLNTPSIYPRTNIEGLGPTEIHTRISASNDARITLPASYDARLYYRLIIIAHGNNDSYEMSWTNTDLRPVVTGLVNDNCIVASGYYHGNNWGNQQSVDDLVALHDYVTSKYPVNGVGLLGVSMGGLTTLNTVVQRKIPVAAWCGIYPVTNLASLYANPTYVSFIEAAYSFSGSSNYAAATAGYDPILRPGSAFLGIPMLMFASTGDTAVPKATNSDALASLVANNAEYVSVVACTGNHGDPSHFQAAAVVDFFNKWFGRAR